jgi:transposase InsO family protein
MDNGTQFDAETFKDFCDQIGKKIHFASVRHPESNGLVEKANDIIMTGIMKLIFNQPKGKCGATIQLYQDQQVLHHSNYCLATKL